MNYREKYWSGSLSLVTYYSIECLKFMQLQACVAKGHPKEAIESYQVTLTMDSLDEEEYLHGVEFPEPDFISLVVDQLVIQS